MYSIIKSERDLKKKRKEKKRKSASNNLWCCWVFNLRLHIYYPINLYNETLLLNTIIFIEFGASEGGIALTERIFSAYCPCQEKATERKKNKVNNKKRK